MQKSKWSHFRSLLKNTFEWDFRTLQITSENQPFNEKLPITASDRASAGPWPNPTYGLLFKIFQIYAFVSKAHIIERQY